MEENKNNMDNKEFLEQLHEVAEAIRKLDVDNIVEEQKKKKLEERIKSRKKDK